MSGPTKWRSFIRNQIWRVTYYFATWTGIISLRYDFKRRQVMYSSRQQWYACFMNGLVVLIGPFVTWNKLKLVDFYGDNKVMYLTIAVHLLMRFLAANAAVIFRWRREQKTKEIILELLKLEQMYFDGLQEDPTIEAYFDRLIFVQNFMLWFQSITMFFTTYHSVQEFSWILFLFFVYYINIVNILHGVLFHYFIGLWLISKRLYLLNERLKRIVNTLLQGDRESIDFLHHHYLAPELHTIGTITGRLMDLVNRLSENYRLQVMTVTFSQILKIISTGYFVIIVFSDNAKVKLNLLEQIIGISIYLVNLYNFYYTQLMCDVTCESQNLMMARLKKFNEIAHYDEEFEQNCSLISQLMNLRKLHINMYGMFQFNRRTAFNLCAAILMHTIILLQFDIKTRIEKTVFGLQGY